MDQTKGFIETLLDFSFSDFVTTKVIKVLFVIGLVFALVGAISFIAGGFGWGVFWGILALLVSPLVFLVYALLIRVYLEIIIVLFRIAENVQRLADAKSAPPAPQAARRAETWSPPEDSASRGTVAEDGEEDRF